MVATDGPCKFLINLNGECGKKNIPTGIQIRILPVPAFNPTKEHPGAPMFGIILGLDPKKWLVFQSTVTATGHIPSQ